MDGGQVVDSSVLQHRQEDKDKADPEINVHRLNVGHPGHGRVHSGDNGGHGQHGGDACTDMSLWFQLQQKSGCKNYPSDVNESCEDGEPQRDWQGYGRNAATPITMHRVPVGL